MKTLLWCELKTKRLWGIPLMACVIVPMAFGDPCTFWGDWTANTVWFWPAALVVGVLFGLTAFSGDLGSGVNDFLFSRPVSWKKVVLAKMAVGLGTIALVAILGAIAFRFLCPSPYIPFLTAMHMAKGTALAFLIIATPYLVGLSCSLVLPGFIGAILTLLAVAVSYGAEITLFKLYSQQNGYYEVNDWLFLPWAVGLSAAALFTMRFGLTMGVTQRFKRFAGIVLGCVVLLSPFMPRTTEMSQRALEPTYYNFSPNFSQAAVERWEERGVSHNVWRIADGRMADIPYDSWLNSSQIHWVSNDTSIWVEKHYLNKRGPVTSNPHLVSAALSLARFNFAGRLDQKHLKIDINDRSLIPDDFLNSPDGKTVALISRIGGRNYRQINTYQFLDMPSFKRHPLIIRSYGEEVSWWQSNKEFGYLDEGGKRHIVTVSK